jgi:hypothetical protein
MNIKNIALASACVGGVLLFSAFGGSKMTLEEQTKKIEATVAENVATFEARKREECRAMALQKAIGLAETKLAEETKTSGKAAMTKKGAPAPKKAPKVTPKSAPDQKTRTGASNVTTPEAQKTRSGATTITNDPASQKVRGGATKIENKNN